MNCSKNIINKKHRTTLRMASCVAIHLCLLVLSGMTMISSVNAQVTNPEKAAIVAVLKGVVKSDLGEPISGANVFYGKPMVAVQTQKDGSFEFRNVPVGAVIRITSLGFRAEDFKVKNDEKVVAIKLVSNNIALNEVVINTGLYKRPVGNFTGAARRITGDELKMVNPQNVLQAISAMEPSFRIQENNVVGSDPNQLQKIQLRGQNNLPIVTQGNVTQEATPITNGDIMSSYLSNPNQPLIILDGFQISLQELSDMDINRIGSVTILKDAAATTAYGAKSANGVIVIETKQLPIGKLQASYSINFNLQAPDLSSYHLMNAAELLEAQRISGMYTNPTNNFTDLAYKQWYDYRLEQVKRGVNTYWLSQPVQTGFGITHSLNVGGSAKYVRYSMSVNYGEAVGVMKGSDRTNMGLNANLSYNRNGLRISNSTSVAKNIANNSPWGKYADYAKQAPYFNPYDDEGNIKKILEPSFVNLGFPMSPPGSGAINIINPMYNSNLNSIDQSSMLSFNNRTNVDWAINSNFRLAAGLSFATNLPKIERFLPAEHTSFVGSLSPTIGTIGSYSQSKGENQVLDGQLSLNYVKKIGLHTIFAALGGSGQSTTSTSTAISVFGLPNDYLSELGLANGFGTSTRPSAANNNTRSLSSFLSVSYNYDERYTAEVTGNASGSSQFGSNKSFAPFWAGGVGWNVDKEKFFKANKVIQQLRIRASIGITGNQNFASKSQQTYLYNLTSNYRLQLGAGMTEYINPDLKWQQTLKQNLGVNMSLFKGKLNIGADVFNEVTDNLILPLSIAPSSGFPSYQNNLGATKNSGYEVNFSAPIFRNTAKNIFWTIHANAGHFKNVITRLSPAIDALNKANNAVGVDQKSPLARLEVGQSMSRIWAVKSLGIDPATGKELYQKLDGSSTFIWDTADKVVVGDGASKLKGSFGTNFNYKSFSLNIIMGYEFGGQAYNTTLVDKIENVNLTNGNADIRVLRDRWKAPGDHSFFKSLVADASTNTLLVTKATSRFVQNNNYLEASSISIGYSVSPNARWVRRLKISAPRFAITENNAFRFATIKQERGTGYPFARSYSFGLSTTF